MIVTSHQAFFTREALLEIARVTMQNINEFYAGKELTNRVCPDPVNA